MSSDDDLSDMLTELRVLLLSAQLFTAFLMTLPFSAGFRQIVLSEKWVFLATFICSVVSLVLFTAPAVQHRMMRPLLDRVTFKHLASGQMLMGASALSAAVVLGVDLIISEVFGHVLGGVVAATVATLIIALWWLLPHLVNRRLSSSARPPTARETQ
ncbi:DUF6328 family protein [Undibacterium sp. Jales W-56]|uniref:DUF6328 family protein n=1 Tax=Undibacterium sp. Jales W-56 TaxID=2897325 RepID=UPI0021CE11E3|nr:DUF6328 family protein [Undibacterium sp. Jales W-56]MCU6435298.1 DUF6328 family protein [Undibacterium sp. Jales W-56]